MVTWVTPLLSPVLAPHEPDCLGKAVGERRQLGSAMRQTFDGLQLLRGSGGDGFGFLRRGVGTRLGLLERLMDSGRPLPDAMRQLRDLFPGAGRAPRRLCNAGQVLYPLARAAHDGPEIAADALEQLCGAVERPARLLCGLPDVARLSTACFGELVDLIRHHREAPPVNPGARRFDRGVEGEQVGLVGDEADGFRELLDLLRHVAQPPYLAGALFGRETQIGQATDGGLGGEADLLRGLLHLRARVASLGARGGHLRGVVGQLFRVAGQRADEARGLGCPPAGPSGPCPPFLARGEGRRSGWRGGPFPWSAPSARPSRESRCPRWPPPRRGGSAVPSRGPAR